MIKNSAILRTLALLGVAASAPNLLAQSAPTPTITVEATMAPNFFGSPSFDAWAANGIYAAEYGLTTYGAAGPTQFNVDSSVLPVIDNIVTGFASWGGNANPAAPYNNEEGTRASFVAIINGNGGLINMNGFGATLSGGEPGNPLGFVAPDNSISPDDWNYDQLDIGLIFNNGVNINGGFSVVDSGSPDQLVNEIISIGAGDAYASLTAAEGGDDPNLSDSNQQILDYDAGSIPSYDFTGTFTYGTASGSATAVFAPDATSTFALMTGSLAGLAALRRRFVRA